MVYLSNASISLSGVISVSEEELKEVRYRGAWISIKSTDCAMKNIASATTLLRSVFKAEKETGRFIA